MLWRSIPKICQGYFELLPNDSPFFFFSLNRDTAGQERFRTITTAYYRGAMGILLVYDVTDEQSFQNIRTWIRNIEQHAAQNVDKVLIGNKCDMEADKQVETARAQRLADEYSIALFEASAKNNINVTEAFTHIAKDIKRRLMDSAPSAQNEQHVDVNSEEKPKKGCC